MACLDGVAHHCGVCDRSVDNADELERELDALKAQLATEREANRSLRSELKLSMDGERGLMAAVLGTIGGQVEGAPTLPINYLQRLRELTLKEALLAISKTQLDAEREAHARTLAALRAVVGHFVGVDHHRDDCPGLLDHDGLTVLGPVCRDHQVAEQAEAAIAAAKVTP